METGQANRKQLLILAVLGAVLVFTVARGMLRVATPSPVQHSSSTNNASTATGNSTNAATASAATASAATPATSTAGSAAAGQVGQGSSNGAPAAAAVPSGTAIAQVFPVLPSELRNPFSRPGNLTVPGAAPAPVSNQPTPPPAPAQIHTLMPPPLPVAIGPLPVAIRPQPTRPIQTTVPQPAPHPVAPVGPAPAPAPVVPTPAPPPPPDMEAIYQADATAEKANVVLRGVLVGAPSIAFVSVSGKEQVLHINDVLPGGFRVEAITEHGIVLFYSKDETLNKTLNIGL